MTITITITITITMRKCCRARPLELEIRDPTAARCFALHRGRGHPSYSAPGFGSVDPRSVPRDAQETLSLSLFLELKEIISLELKETLKLK